MSAAELRVVVGADVKHALTGMKQVSSGVQALAKTGGKTIPISVDAKNATAGIAKVKSGLDGLTKLALGFGAALLGLKLLASVPKLLGDAIGLDLAIELENTTAQLNAITKSGVLTASILDRVREEADKTAFGFAELASGTAALLPLAKQSGIGYMTLLKTAELLAATNPAQGLEGAVFALREAASGDFVSLKDRFNIPGSTITRLRKQTGNISTLVERALGETGVDRSLIDRMGETFTGRLSTFTDAINTIRLEAGKPVLTALTREIERFTGIIGLNNGTLKTWAATLGGKIAAGISTVGQEAGTLLQTATNIAKTHNLGLPQSLEIATELRIGELFGPGAAKGFHGVIDAIKGIPKVLEDIKTFFDQGFPDAIKTIERVAGEITATIAKVVADIKVLIAELLTDLATADIPFVSDKLKPAADRMRAAAGLGARADDGMTPFQRTGIQNRTAIGNAIGGVLSDTALGQAGSVFDRLGETLFGPGGAGGAISHVFHTTVNFNHPVIESAAVWTDLMTEAHKAAQAAANTNAPGNLGS